MREKVEEQTKTSSTHQLINSSTPLLKAEALSHSFDYPLFSDVNITLNPLESIAIIGPSGCGKSTLLNILSSLLKPNSGKVTFLDHDLYKLSKKELLSIRRRDFGIIFQAHYLFRGFSAKQNLNIAELLSSNSIDETLLQDLKIDHVINQGVGELSGGQQQRLSISRVLTKRPNVIFADEPTGNLDKETANEVMDVLFKYIRSNNAGLILVTHENDLANRCDKVYKLDNLKLIQIK